MSINTAIAAKNEKHLSKLIRLNGKVDTYKNHIDYFHNAGTLSLRTFEETKIKPMSRLAFHRANQKEQDAHEEKMRLGGMITVYLVNNFDLGKIAYDYAMNLSTLHSTPGAK